MNRPAPVCVRALASVPDARICYFCGRPVRWVFDRRPILIHGYSLAGEEPGNATQEKGLQEPGAE